MRLYVFSVLCDRKAFSLVISNTDFLGIRSSKRVTTFLTHHYMLQDGHRKSQNGCHQLDQVELLLVCSKNDRNIPHIFSYLYCNSRYCVFTWFFLRLALNDARRDVFSRVTGTGNGERVDIIQKSIKKKTFHKPVFPTNV